MADTLESGSHEFSGVALLDDATIVELEELLLESAVEAQPAGVPVEEALLTSFVRHLAEARGPASN